MVTKNVGYGGHFQVECPLERNPSIPIRVSGAVGLRPAAPGHAAAAFAAGRLYQPAVPRRVIRELGSVGLCTTDLVNARSLLEKNRKALKLIETCAEDSPPRRAALRLRAGGDARRGADAGAARRRLGRHQHGLPGAQGLPGWRAARP
ncbi:MAG: hypothetical protein WDO13_14900 [Verrucomicrobiota bacterium]